MSNERLAPTGWAAATVLLISYDITPTLTLN